MSPFIRSLFTRLVSQRWKITLGSAVALLIVEIAVLPLIAAYAPLHVRMRLPGPLYVLSQSSKSGLLPQDWTLVLGDSYAHGYGDWLGEVQGAPGNPAFHSTHVMHEMTGEDYMSFGQGGAGSMKGIVFLLEKRMKALVRTGLSNPSKIVVFVYEGNDFLNNLDEAKRYGGLECGDDESKLVDLCVSRARVGTSAGILGTFFLPAMVINKVKGRQGVPPESMGTHLLRLPDDSPVAEGSKATNVVRVDGDLFQFMGPADGPPIGLSSAELDWSIASLRASLDWLKRRFDDVPVCVVFVPSPLTCYDIASPRIDLGTWFGEPWEFDATEVEACHSLLVRRVAEVTTEVGFEFLDATQALRATARRRPLHGPLDGSHFNRAGYESLGRLIADRAHRDQGPVRGSIQSLSRATD